MKNRLQAFTLIELLVVIVIIGILSGMGISTYNTYIEKARMAKAQSFAVQVERQLLADSTANEIDFIGWYDFRNAEDISQVSPYIKDSSPYEINITGRSGNGTFEQSNDTPLGNGFSLKLLNDISFSEWIPVSSQNNQSVSVAAWIKVVKPKFDTSRSTPFIRSGNSSANGLAVKDDNTVIFYINNNFGDSVKGDIVPGKWHYVVGAFKNDLLTLWIDGELVETAPESLEDPMIHDIIILGDSGANGFEGFMDDIIITPTPLGDLK